MRQLRLLAAVLAVTMFGAASVSLACDKDKSAQASSATAAAASAKSAACTPAMAAKCTPEMAAACKAARTSAAAFEACGSAKTSATTAATTASVTATTASTAITTAADGCSGMKSADMSACAGHHKVSATAAGADHCGGMKSAAGHSCGTGMNSATAAHKCLGAGMLSAAGSSIHAECDACHDMADCGAELDAAGAHSQVVSLKNGVIFVYTADSPAQVRAVQAAMVRRTERLNALLTAGDKAKLCDECKLMRGAMASGKLQREVVNVEGGCLTLMTSSDTKVVNRIHALVDSRLVASRGKS